MLRKMPWYHLIFASLLLVPALVCQTVMPVIPYSFWEELSEPVYAQLLRLQKPAATQASRVAIVEIDDKTLETYGWPIDRTYYVKFLAKLKAAGHPWVLSMLQFQAQENVKSDSLSKKERTKKDEALAKAMRDYGRYVGSGLKVEPGAELTARQEDEVLPRVLLSRTGKAPGELPYLPLSLGEDQRFVDAQKAFGFGTHFGAQSVIRCMQFYITDINHTGRFVIPSSLVWTAAYATEARIDTTSGANWPRPGERQPYSFKRKLPVAYKHCLTSPGLLTRDFLATRRIAKVSFTDVVEGTAPRDFKGRVVLLARNDMRKFRGPGFGGDDDKIVPEHVLAARFLDGVLTGETIRREDLSRKLIMTWLPLAAAAVFSLASLVLSPAGLCVFTLATLGGLVTVSATYLLDGIYLIPMQTMTSVAATTVGLAGLYAYLRYYGIRRQIRFASRLRDGLSRCNTLFEIETLARQVCREEFETAKLDFGNYDRRLYLASSDANAALALIDNKPDVTGEGAQFAPRVDSVVTRVNRPKLARVPLRWRAVEVVIAVESELGRLGTISLSCTFKAHEEDFIAGFVEALRTETAQHWHRIKLLVDQKLLDYKFLTEQTRGDIMERFLTQVIVSKFTNGKTMMENLGAVLTPRPTRAALMQADIRGYSRVSATMAPLDMVKLLQRYFSTVVDAAQMVAQVKLIGDCIFLFIEEAAGTADCSPADLAIDLAAILVAETNKQNALRAEQQQEALNFGIAIHYGDVVVGNLSSDSCIDYTVIGPNVNFVARLEELTKNPAINAIVGTNGTLVSVEAQAALIKHRGMQFTPIDLGEVGANVRSFSHVKRVLGMRAAATEAVEPSDLLIQQKAS